MEILVLRFSHKENPSLEELASIFLCSSNYIPVTSTDMEFPYHQLLRTNSVTCYSPADFTIMSCKIVTGLCDLSW